MHWLLEYQVATDYAERRASLRAEHLRLAWESASRGELVLGGAVEDPLDRALLVFRGEGPSAAETFAANDPYVRNGLVTSWNVRPWRTVAGDLAETPVQPPTTQVPPAPTGTRIGHVHLKVADLERATRFWCDVLGFSVTQRYGDGAVFLAVDGYHHHIGLNTWESAGGTPPPPGSTGLFHVALLYPSRAALAAVVRSLIAHAWPLEGAADHGVSEAIYLRDPDGNGLELAVDRPRDRWPVDDRGRLAMFTRPLDIAGLLAEAP